MILGEILGREKSTYEKISLANIPSLLSVILEVPVDVQFHRKFINETFAEKSTTKSIPPEYDSYFKPYMQGSSADVYGNNFFICAPSISKTDENKENLPNTSASHSIAKNRKPNLQFQL